MLKRLPIYEILAVSPVLTTSNKKKMKIDILVAEIFFYCV